MVFRVIQHMHKRPSVHTLTFGKLAPLKSVRHSSESFFAFKLDRSHPIMRRSDL